MFFVHSDRPILITSKTPFKKVKEEVHITNIQQRLTSITLVVHKRFNHPDKVQLSIPYSSMDDQQTPSKIMSILYKLQMVRPVTHILEREVNSLKFAPFSPLSPHISHIQSRYVLLFTHSLSLYSREKTNLTVGGSLACLP